MFESLMVVKKECSMFDWMTVDVSGLTKVVCAMGPGCFSGMLSTLPWWAEDLAKCLISRKDQEEKEEDCVICNTICTRDEEEKVSSVSPACRVQHSFTLTPWLRDERNLKLLKDARILVIGGGQTAAHLVKGCST